MADAPISRAARTADPRIAVVVPFGGDPGRVAEVAGRLARLVGPGVDCVIVDNTIDGVDAATAIPEAVGVVRADGVRSSYRARNVGARATGGEWILFIDADCDPPGDLVDRYLSTTPPPTVGAIAGEIDIPPDQSGLLSDWARTRRVLSQEAMLSDEEPAAASANLMVRRAAFEAVGGFCDGIRSGGDVELCWRLIDAGWQIEHSPRASVEHPARPTLRAVWRQFVRYGAGNAWQGRRFPGRAPDLSLAPLARRLFAGAALALTMRPRRAAMAAIDAVSVAGRWVGRWLDNVAPNPARDASQPAPGPSVVVVTDFYPVVSETFVEADVRGLRERGWRVRVEAVARPRRPRLDGGWGLTVDYAEDEGPLHRLGALVWIALRRPLRVLADRGVRRRFDPSERLPLRAVAPIARRLVRRGEERVHAHFGAGASVTAIRAARIAGVPVSVTLHGHDIYREPKALPAKLAHADVVVTPCTYTASDLRALMPERDRERVHRVVVGVDPERFRRRTEYPRGSTLVAVGRLVEKKGFDHLIEAVATLKGRGAAPEAVVIVGDGPLRDQLVERASSLGIGDRIELPGAVEPDRVRDLLERAALFCLPCVVAADGDRDSMPLVVKEAMAMEIPVVVTREVGLPEIVEDGWGRLVEPRDSAALADAIEDVLGLPYEERRALGAAGRRAVEERAHQAREIDRLARLLDVRSGAGAG